MRPAVVCLLGGVTGGSRALLVWAARSVQAWQPSADVKTVIDQSCGERSGRASSASSDVAQCRASVTIPRRSSSSIVIVADESTTRSSNGTNMKSGSQTADTIVLRSTGSSLMEVECSTARRAGASSCIRLLCAEGLVMVADASIAVWSQVLVCETINCAT